MDNSSLEASGSGEGVAVGYVEGLAVEQIEEAHRSFDPPGITSLARETMDLPLEWTAVSWAIQGDYPDPWGMKVEGGVYPPLLSGKRKGKPNFRKGTMLRTFVASMAQIKAHEAAWEARTGLCRYCRDTGWKWAGWNHERGNRYKPCGCGRPQMELAREAKASEPTL